MAEMRLKQIDKLLSPCPFWTEQDVLQYLVEYNVLYASVYGENRFQMLAKTHFKLYNYCMNGGEEVEGVWQPDNNGLGLTKVLYYIGVDYTPHKPLKSKKLFEPQ